MQIAILALFFSAVLAQGSGRLTYYDVGLGKCGSTDTNSQMVVAMVNVLAYFVKIRINRNSTGVHVVDAFP